MVQKSDKEILGNISKASLEESYKCGECLHFRRHTHPAFKEICHKRGIRSFRVAPKCFTPDVTQVASNSDTFVQLATMFADYTPKQKRIMIGILKSPMKKFKRELPFGTKVYFLGMGKDYISNYLSGYVMGVTSSGQLIITGSPDKNTRGRSYFAYMDDSESLLTYKEWKAKYKELKAANKIIDPQSLVLPKGASPGTEPITIDSAPDAWYDKQEKKKTRGIQDLVMKIS